MRAKAHRTRPLRRPKRARHPRPVTAPPRAPAKETWAEYARKSTWFFWLETGAVGAGIIGFVAAVFGLWITSSEIRETREFREGVEKELATETLAEIRAARQFREELERDLAERTLAELEAAARQREQEGIARAWALLTTPASGNSGKVEALEYLATHLPREVDELVGDSVVLSGIDLSCETMGGMEGEDDTATCTRPTYLRGLDLSRETHGARVRLNGANLSGADLLSANLRGARLGRANLSGVILFDANLSEASLEGVDLSGAFLRDADLRGTILEFADLNGTSLGGAKLSGASLWAANLSEASLAFANLSAADLVDADLSGADLRNADLSGAFLWDADLSGANVSSADFTDARGLETANFTGAWAWADAPSPINLPVAIDLCVFDADEGHLLWERPETCSPTQ